jgi:hypothetical protein
MPKKLKELKRQLLKRRRKNELKAKGLRARHRRRKKVRKLKGLSQPLKEYLPRTLVFLILTTILSLQS